MVRRNREENSSTSAPINSRSGKRRTLLFFRWSSSWWKCRHELSGRTMIARRTLLRGREPQRRLGLEGHCSPLTARFFYDAWHRKRRVLRQLRRGKFRLSLRSGTAGHPDESTITIGERTTKSSGRTLLVLIFPLLVFFTLRAFLRSPGDSHSRRGNDARYHRVSGKRNKRWHICTTFVII